MDKTKDSLKRKIKARQNKIIECEKLLERTILEIKKIELLPDSPAKKRTLLLKQSNVALINNDIVTARLQISILEYNLKKQNQNETSFSK